ncbi:MAG: hypothetical protein J6M10_10385 [Clostridia bacterium]|nr:hypothetical protein [Clostridia bacterium]
MKNKDERRAIAELEAELAKCEARKEELIARHVERGGTFARLELRALLNRINGLRLDLWAMKQANAAG